MASKDYVRRGSGARKKPAPKKTAKPLPIRSGLIAIAAVSLFGYGLTFLSQTPEPTPKVVTAPVVKPKPKPKTENSLPPPPEQKWDYEQLLPNKEIEVTAKELEVSDIPYVMQCGAYKTLAQAEERKAMIAFRGSPAGCAIKKAVAGIGSCSGLINLSVMPSAISINYNERRSSLVRSGKRTFSYLSGFWPLFVYTLPT